VIAVRTEQHGFVNFIPEIERLAFVASRQRQTNVLPACLSFDPPDLSALCDEFYTQLVDIENELKHYKTQLRGKSILCNCDDPYESNFLKHFALNFNALELQKLIATSYTKSPIVGGQLRLLDIEGLKPGGKEPYAIEINNVPDQKRRGTTDITDVEYLLKHDANAAWTLKGNGEFNGGDFRSRECIDLLKRADIVITNPPFSLFRQYVLQLVENGKQFLIIGSLNAVHYKEICTAPR
jgi:hypothetical protein